MCIHISMYACMYGEFPDVHLRTADRNSTHHRFWLAVGIHYVEYTRNLIINKCEEGRMGLACYLAHTTWWYGSPLRCIHNAATLAYICVQKRTLAFSLSLCMYICLHCRKHPLCSGILEARIVYCAGIGATPLYMLASPSSSCPHVLYIPPPRRGLILNFTRTQLHLKYYYIFNFSFSIFLVLRVIEFQFNLNCRLIK